MTRELRKTPNRENSPVSISKRKRAAKAIKKSMHIMDLPISSEVNFRSSIAAMSVPPVLAFWWNNMAVPMAGRQTEKISSSRRWSVMGAERGKIHSMP